jgi:hypothetical protein
MATAQGRPVLDRHGFVGLSTLEMVIGHAAVHAQESRHPLKGRARPRHVPHPRKHTLMPPIACGRTTSRVTVRVRGGAASGFEVLDRFARELFAARRDALVPTDFALLAYESAFDVGRGWSNRRPARSDFPEPVAELHTGAVWMWAHVRGSTRRFTRWARRAGGSPAARGAGLWSLLGLRWAGAGSGRRADPARGRVRRWRRAATSEWTWRGSGRQPVDARIVESRVESVPASAQVAECSGSAGVCDRCRWSVLGGCAALS